MALHNNISDLPAMIERAEQAVNSRLTTCFDCSDTALHICANDWCKRQLCRAHANHFHQWFLCDECIALEYEAGGSGTDPKDERPH